MKRTSWSAGRVDNSGILARCQISLAVIVGKQPWIGR